jgi:hypothetical protein
MKWTDKFPKQEGKYWFYGDPHLGSMGMHYKDDYKIEPEMYLLDVKKISNGLIGVTEGQFVPSNKFDKTKTREGYLGYFAKAELPDIPEDTLNLFVEISCK